MMKRTAARQLPLLLAFAALGAQAQYKVVAPDGSVTYTDRPPADTKARITPLNARAGNTVAGLQVQSLPAELRQPASRFPVTLYVADGCAPCVSARALLRQRGIPFSEKLISSSEEAAELQRIVGGPSLPALTVGSQAMSGLSSETWNNYLDAAGYPRESKLPANFQYPPITPLIERAQATPKAAQEPAAPPGTGSEPAPSPGGIKF
jgi:glutaredoxin